MGHALWGSGTAHVSHEPPDGCQVKPAWLRPPDRLWWRSHSAVRSLRSDGRDYPSAYWRLNGPAGPNPETLQRDSATATW